MRDVSGAQAFGELSMLVRELSSLYRSRTIREITQRALDYGAFEELLDYGAVEEWMRPEEWMSRGYGPVVRRAKNLKTEIDYLLAVKVFTPPKNRESTTHLFGTDPAAEPRPQALEQGTQAGYAKAFPEPLKFPDWVPPKLDESEKLPTYVVISGPFGSVGKSGPVKSKVAAATQFRIGLGPSDIFVCTAPFREGLSMLENLEAAVEHLANPDLKALYWQRRVVKGRVLTDLAIRSSYAPVINEGLDVSSNFAAIRELTLHPGEKNNALYVIKPGAPRWGSRDKAIRNGGDMR